MDESPKLVKVTIKMRASMDKINEIMKINVMQCETYRFIQSITNIVQVSKPCLQINARAAG